MSLVRPRYRSQVASCNSCRQLDSSFGVARMPTSCSSFYALLEAVFTAKFAAIAGGLAGLRGRPLPAQLPETRPNSPSPCARAPLPEATPQLHRRSTGAPRNL